MILINFQLFTIKEKLENLGKEISRFSYNKIIISTKHLVTKLFKKFSFVNELPAYNIIIGGHLKQLFRNSVWLCDQLLLRDGVSIDGKVAFDWTNSSGP